MKTSLRPLASLALLCLFLAAPPALRAQDAPQKKSPPATPGWIELIGTRGLDAWREPRGEWKVAGEVAPAPANDTLLAAKEGEGILVNGAKGKTHDLITTAEFGDVMLHVEFLIPAHSNSGLYFMGRYELQIYDSYGVKKDKYPGIECGGIYERWDKKKNKGYEGHSPRVNVAKAPGEWQSFDVIFFAPRFGPDGKKIANARFMQVMHNGVLVHRNVQVTGPTRAATDLQPADEKPTGPLLLQGDHGPVAFRNLRIRELKSSPEAGK